MPVAYTTENKPIEYKSPEELEREAYTKSLYQDAANAYDFGYPLTPAQLADKAQFASKPKSKPASTLSSTEGENIYNKTVTEPLAKAEQRQQEAQGKTKEPPKPEDTLLQNELDATKTEEQKAAESKKKDVESTFAPIIAEGNAILNAQVATINSQYDQLVAKQAEANARRVKLEETIGIRSGAARYTAGTAADLVQDQISIGLAKIGEINAKRQDALSAVQTEHRKGNMTLAFEKAKVLAKIDDDRDNAIRDLNKEMREANKKADETKRLLDIEAVVSDSVLIGALDKNAIYRTLRIAGYNPTTKEVEDAFNNVIPKEVASSDISPDERIFKQMKAEGVLPPEATMFDFWKKKGEATRDPKSVDPALQILREYMIQEKAEKLNNYITFTPKDQKEFDYADAFGSAVSNATQGEAAIRGRKFSDLIKRGEYSQAREFIFQTALETTPVDTYKQISGAADTLKALSGFKTLINEMATAGVPTNIITGTAEDIARKLGATTNTQYVAFKSRMSKILFDYRKAMTGVQFSYEEGEQYKELFPQYKNDISINSELIKQITASLSSQVDNFYARKLGSGLYNKLASEGFSEAYGIGEEAPPVDVESARSELKEGEILIERNGVTGVIPENEFNSKTDKKI